MENNYSIEVQDVYKTFNVYLDKANSLKEKMLFWKRNRKEVREVLKGINLNINRGEAVALIGVNGSGKSTLLKLMTKIIYPNKGKITTHGKLTSLLELGAGFHQDFSGRENIYFNASIFGLTKKEIDARFEKLNNKMAEAKKAQTTVKPESSSKSPEAKQVQSIEKGRASESKQQQPVASISNTNNVVKKNTVVQNMTPVTSTTAPGIFHATGVN